MNKKIRIVSALYSTTLDSFEHGEDPSTTELHSLYREDEIYDTLEDLCKALYLKYDRHTWMAYQDGRLVHDRLQTELNHPSEYDNLEPTEEQMELWKNGEIDLYNAHYDIWIELVDIHTPTVEEMSEKFNIPIY